MLISHAFCYTPTLQKPTIVVAELSLGSRPGLARRRQETCKDDVPIESKDCLVYRMKRLQLVVNFFAIICWLVIAVFLTCVYISEQSIPSYVYFETSRIDNDSISSASPETVVNDTKVDNSSSHEYECHTSLSSDGRNFQQTGQDDQPKRVALMEKVCQEEKAYSSKIEKRHFLLDDKRGIFYCWIHKVASTSWIAFMARLKGIHVPPSKVYRKIGHLAAKSMKEAMSAANDYPFRFIVVRHPFHRLISAYRDRIWAATKKYSAQAWTHVPKMLRLSRPSLSHSSAASFLNNENRTLMTVPTFGEFVEYLIAVAGLQQPQGNSSKKVNMLNISAFDAHWVPYHYHCSICNISYNVIIKLETIEKDVDHFINELNSAGKKSNKFFRRLSPKGNFKNTSKSDHQTGKGHVNPVKADKNEFVEKKSGNSSNCTGNDHQGCETEREISDLFLHHLQQSDMGPSCLCFYFSQLSKAQFDGLKKIYDIDLKMFNYDTYEYEKCLTKDR